MATCGNCGSTLEHRRCLSCAAEAAKAQPHVKSPLGFRLVGAGLSGVLLAGLLVLGVASASKASPEVVLRQATEATIKADTATFTTTAIIKTSGSFASKHLDLRGSGVTNYVAHETSLTMHAPGIYVEEVKDHTTIYLRTSPNGEWTSVVLSKISGLSGITGPGAFTPQAIAQQDSSFSKAVEAGSTSVNGHACTKYDIPIASSSFSKDLEKRLGSNNSGIGAAMVKSLLKDIHVTQSITIDNSSHLIREMSLKLSMTLFGQTLTEKITMVLDHFGEPVNIEIPTSATPADKLPSLF